MNVIGNCCYTHEIDFSCMLAVTTLCYWNAHDIMKDTQWTIKGMPDRKCLTAKVKLGRTHGA